MRFSPTVSALYVSLCQSKSRPTTITYVTKIYNLSEYEFAWWDLGGDNLALWRGQGGKRTVAAGTGWGRRQRRWGRGGDEDNGGKDGVGMGTKLWGWGGDGDKIFTVSISRRRLSFRTPVRLTHAGSESKLMTVRTWRFHRRIAKGI